MIFDRSSKTSTIGAADDAAADGDTPQIATDLKPASEGEARHDDAPSRPAAAKAADPHHSYGGWVRVDSDNVLRGWVTDRKDRAVHPLVEVLIDDEPVALRAADRYDPKLQELGEGDGCYAFAVVIPEEFRDGRPHSFDARVKDGGFQLKSKRADFVIEPDEAVPALQVDRSVMGRVSGRLHGGQFTRPPSLELWRGGKRLGDVAEVQWGNFGFSASYPLDLLQGSDEAAPLLIAAAGMVEAGLPAPSADFELPELTAQIDDEGVLDLSAQGFPAEAAVVLEVVGADGGLLFEKALDLSSGRESVDLPPEAREGETTFRLAVDGWTPQALVFHPAAKVGLLVENASFRHWRAHGPAAWTCVAGEDAVARGFHAFPDRIVEQQGVTGDFAHVEVKDVAPSQWVVLLSQPLLRAPPAGEPVTAALMARASERATLRLQVTDADGAELASFDLEARKPWLWDYVAAPLTLDGAPADARLQVSVSAEDATDTLMVDIAGARLGGAAFAAEDESAIEAAPAATAANAVINADLTEWPNGVVIKNAVGRAELARGWFGFNRRTTSPVMARAVFEIDSDAVGMAVAAPVVPDYCRLEIQLDSEALEQLTEGTISFEAGATLGARTLLAETAASVPEFLLIDRVMVLRRRPVVTERGFQLSDETVATVGRRLLLTRSLYRFDLPLAVAAPAAGSDFAWEQTGEDADLAEYWLVLEFRQPFAVTLRHVSLIPGPIAPQDESPYLALEDRSIAAQAEHIKGLAAWISPHVATPLAMQEDLGPRPTLRWRWSRSQMGTVEVVVCVYNAVEETLACLRSLMVSTQVPHTVRIIDDASEPLVGQRLDAFVADKPWMTVIHHEQNQGYTASADEGIRTSDADWVVLLNSDTVVTPGWLEGLLEAAASGDDVAMVGPVSNAATFQSVPDLYDAANKFKTNPLPAGWTPADMADLVAELSEKAFPDAPLLNGFCTLMRREVFLGVGGLNKAAFPTGYGEENDLCARVAKAGWRLVLADHVYVYHSKSASFGSARRTELAKAGSKALKELHPDVDFNALTARFREIPSLVRLRAAIRETYEEQI